MSHKLNNPRDITVVVFGDSITAPKELTEHLYFMFLVALNRGDNIRVVNASQGGRPAAAAVSQVGWRVLIHQPDVVIVQYGFNDVRHDEQSGARGKPISTPGEFDRHLRGIVTQIREGSRAKVLIIANHKADQNLILPTGRGYDESRVLYNEVGKRVAAEMKTDHLDMEAAFAATPHPFTAFVSDSVHLSPLGIRYYATTLANKLQEMLYGA